MQAVAVGVGGQGNWRPVNQYRRLNPHFLDEKIIKHKYMRMMTGDLYGPSLFLYSLAGYLSKSSLSSYLSSNLGFPRNILS